jgi:hypothetical protein
MTGCVTRRGEDTKRQAEGDHVLDTGRRCHLQARERGLKKAIQPIP